APELPSLFSYRQFLRCLSTSKSNNCRKFCRDPFRGSTMANGGISAPSPDFENVSKGLSDYMAFTLDIGHYVANGGDPIAMLQKHHDRIVNLHIKDRKKDNGPNMPYSEGDTPIREVLKLMRDRKYGIPARIEWELAAERNE